MTWKARRAELEVLARRGEQKTERARREPCILDTTVARGLLAAPTSPDEKDAASMPMLLRATLAQFSLANFGVMRPDAFETLFHFLGIANSHPDQLTLAEFCACRTRKLVTNLDLMAIARTVQLRDKSERAEAENADDEADDAGKKTARMTEQFMEGDHDIEAGADMDEADVPIGSTR